MNDTCGIDEWSGPSALMMNWVWVMNPWGVAPGWYEAAPSALASLGIRSGHFKRNIWHC